jgi:RNA polymerase primary sigma factor
MRRRIRRIQRVASEPLTEYLDAIGRYRLLASDEEAALGRRIRMGDGDAVTQLVCANLRFVVSVAKQYQRQGVSLLDLIAEGNLGLIRAAQRFDETRGTRFITYAVWWIRQAIRRAAVDQSCVIRVPARRAADAHRIGRRANALSQKLGREPRQHEIAEELDISEGEVAAALAAAQLHVSLDAPMTGNASSLLDYLASDASRWADNDAVERSRSAAVAEALSQLRARDARIIRLYFGFDGEQPLSLEQIGARLGITRERVRQIRDRALRVLRKNISSLALAG